jgi:hypothetical protein
VIPNNASREGTHIDPPTGAYRVLVWTGGRVEEIASRPETEEGREAAAKLFRGSERPAALCRGATVIKRNGSGEARTAAFKAFAAGVAATTTTVTPRPVEPPAAPVATTTAKPAEEPMPAKTEAAPSCAKCTRYPVALTTAKTHAGTEQWCAHCRRVDAMRRNGTAFGRHAKAVAKAVPAPKSPAKKPAAVEVNRPVSPEGSAVVVEAPASDFATKVRAELARVEAVLLEKNAAYGNSALDPVRVFSRASTEEQLLVRIDDKLSRLARGAAAGEDVVRDLVGYLVLLLIARSAA